MLEKLFLSNYVYYLMGTFFITGVVIKVITGSRLNCLVREGREMNKSTHPFMKLVKAKFEHAFMANGKVDNIDVFVDKFMREYKVGGLTIHIWSKIKVVLTLVLLLIGVVASGMSYGRVGMALESIEKVATATILCSLMVVTYYAVDEKYRLATVKVYMMDYLENVLAKRLDKAYVREAIQEAESAAKELKKNFGAAIVESTTDVFEIDKQNYQESTSGVTLKQVEEVQEPENLKEFEEPQVDDTPTAAMLREILQEFMA